jgi:integrase
MRTKAGGSIGSASSRARLKVRREPYWVPIVRGCALGYRKGITGGTWIARVRAENGRQTYHALGAADDLNDGQGHSYEAALNQARKLFKVPAATGGRYTVAQALERYLEHLRAANPESTVHDTDKRIGSILKPALGHHELAKLQATHITRWRDQAVKAGRKPDTVNRLVNILKAALNRAWKDDRLVADDAAWRMVKRLKGGGARKVFLTASQARHLVAHCKPEALARLVQAALLTGARYGELVRLRVQHFDEATGTLEIGSGKTGARTVYLSSEAVAFFASIALGRPATALLLPRADGTLWGKNHHQKLFDAAVKAAELSSETTFYALRHSHISLALLAGVNIQVLAENCGTSVRMIEQHYGKFLRADRRAMFDNVKCLVPAATETTV